MSRTGYKKVGTIVVGGSPVDSIQYELIDKQFDCMAKYLSYSHMEDAENETVEFEGQLFNKSDLSEETLEWLEWYNSIPPEKQLAVNSIPAELYTDDGVGTVDADQEK